MEPQVQLLDVPVPGTRHKTQSLKGSLGERKRFPIRRGGG